MKYQFSRKVKDAQFVRSAVLAQEDAVTSAIDLEQVNGGEVEKIVAEIWVPAVPGILSGKKLFFYVQDSADGESWEDINPWIEWEIFGDDVEGSAERVLEFRFAPRVRRYVRVSQTATSDAGVFSGSFRFSLLF